VNSEPHYSRRRPESLLWAGNGKLRINSVLTVLVAAHLLTTGLVLPLLMQIEAVR
jgi:hypothetical protein